jgi:anti-sigma factor RsiW
MTCEEIQELITALVDQELTDAERHGVEAHLQDCTACALIAEQQRQVKQAIRARAERMHAPAQLRRNILSDERIFPKRKAASWWRSFRPSTHVARAAFAAALLVVVGLPAFLLLRPRSEPIAAAALATYATLAKAEIPAGRTEKPEEIVSRLAREVGAHFHPMGYDLSGLQMQPVAGSVQEIHGRKVLVVIYRGQGGTLFCYTFTGSEADVPPNAAKFFESAKRMNLYAFSRGPVNAVLHREGDLICILASEIPMAELLELTRSKARAS